MCGIHSLISQQEIRGSGQQCHQNIVQQEDVMKQDVKEDVLQQETKEDVMQQETKEDVVQQDTKEDAVQQDVKENEVKQDAKEDVVQQNTKEDEVQQDAKEDDVQQDAKEDVMQQDAEVQQDAKEGVVHQDTKENVMHQDAKEQDAKEDVVRQDIVITQQDTGSELDIIQQDAGPEQDTGSKQDIIQQDTTSPEQDIVQQDTGSEENIAQQDTCSEQVQYERGTSEHGIGLGKSAADHEEESTLQLVRYEDCKAENWSEPTVNLGCYYVEEKEKDLCLEVSDNEIELDMESNENVDLVPIISQGLQPSTAEDESNECSSPTGPQPAHKSSSPPSKKQKLSCDVEQAVIIRAGTGIQTSDVAVQFPSDDDLADDGYETVFQALPSECAREHALRVNIPPCRTQAINLQPDERQDPPDDGRGWLIQPVQGGGAQEQVLLPTHTPPQTVVEMECPSLELDNQLVPEDSWSHSDTSQSLYMDTPIDKNDKGFIPTLSLGKQLDKEPELLTSTRFGLPSGCAEDMLCTEQCLTPAEQLSNAAVKYPSCFDEYTHQKSQGKAHAHTIVGLNRLLGGILYYVADAGVMNLAKPRLRLGLSKRQKCRSLHDN